MIYSNVLRLKHRLIGKMLRENLKKLEQESNEKEVMKFQKIHSTLKKSETEIGNLLGIVVN